MDDAMKQSAMSETNQPDEKSTRSKKPGARSGEGRIASNSSERGSSVIGDVETATDSEEKSFGQSSNGTELSGVIKKVPVDKPAPGSTLSTSIPEDSSAPVGTQGKEGEAKENAEELDVTKLLSAMKPVNQTSSDSGPDRDKSLRATIQSPPTAAEPASQQHLEKSLQAPLPRVADGNESTQFFQVRSGADSRSGAPPVGKQIQDFNAAKESIGFTQLLRSVSPKSRNTFPEISAIEIPKTDSGQARQESIPIALYPARQAAGEPQEAASLSAKQPSRDGLSPGDAPLIGSASLRRTYRDASNRKLHAMLPWLVILNMVMTAVLIAIAAYNLIHYSRGGPKF